MIAVFSTQLVQNVVLEPMTLKSSSLGVPCYNLALSVIWLMKKRTQGFAQNIEKLLFLAFILESMTV